MTTTTNTIANTIATVAAIIMTEEERVLVEEALKSLRSAVRNIRGLEMRSPAHRAVLDAGMNFQKAIWAVTDRIEEETGIKYLRYTCWTQEVGSARITTREGDVLLDIPRPFIFLGNGYLSQEELKREIAADFDSWGRKIFSPGPDLAANLAAIKVTGLKSFLVEGMSSSLIEELCPVAGETFYRVMGGSLGGDTVTGFWTPSPQAALAICRQSDREASEYGYISSYKILKCSGGRPDGRLLLAHKVNHVEDFDENEVFFDKVETWEEITFSQLRELAD